MTEYRIVSIGGCASSGLIFYLSNNDDELVKHYNTFKHRINPDLLIKDKNKKYKFLFLIGNPYNAVLSVWRRNLQQYHEKAMTFGKYWFKDYRKEYKKVIQEKMTLEEYLSLNIDAFHFEEHIRNWVNYQVEDNTEIMILKYEFIPSHLKEIKNFLNKKDNFKFGLRSSNWKDENKKMQNGLINVYSKVKNLVDVLPPIMEKKKCQWKK